MTAIFRFRGTEADCAEPPVTEPAPTSTLPDLDAPTGDAQSPDDCPTTRRYPRSLFADSAAFPHDPEYGSPITHVGPRWQDRVLNAVYWSLSVVLVVSVAAWAWTR